MVTALGEAFVAVFEVRVRTVALPFTLLFERFDELASVEEQTDHQR